MPCMGPDDNADSADEAYQEILLFLKEKYYIHPDKLLHPKMYQEDMDAGIKNLQQALRDIFRIDSWDGW